MGVLGWAGYIYWYNVSQYLYSLRSPTHLRRSGPTNSAWSHFMARASTTHYIHLEDQSYTSCTGVLMSVAQSVSVAQRDTISAFGAAHWTSTL